MKIGLTLSNRGVLLGMTTYPELLQAAEIADRSGLFQSVWVGDSLLGKPRPESITLLSAIAARTEHVRLGAACMASLPLRDPIQLAYQWATLDQLSGGRTVLIGCTGIVPHEGGRIEAKLYGLEPKNRATRLVEWITLIKRLWTEDHVTFQGEHYRCEEITLEPKPAAQPRPPIWIANNASGSTQLIERTLQRVVDHADGWETSISEPADVRWRLETLRRMAREAGRDPASIETHLYSNINVNEDRQAAYEESCRFLEAYYHLDMSERAKTWVARGSPEQCVEHLRQYAEMGIDEVALRLSAWDQMGQLKRLMEEVIPRLG